MRHARRVCQVFTGLVLVAIWAATAHGQVVLATPAVPRYPNGKVNCSAVNVGDEVLDITVTLIVIDGTSGQVVATPTTECNGAKAVQPSARCKSGNDTTINSVAWCKITTSLPGDSAVQNASLALLKQRVRGAILSFSENASAFTALPAE